jgi:hypothetical protein
MPMPVAPLWPPHWATGGCKGGVLGASSTGRPADVTRAHAIPWLVLLNGDRLQRKDDELREAIREVSHRP